MLWNIQFSLELIQGSVARQLLVVPGVQCLTLKAKTTCHNAELQRRVKEVSVQLQPSCNHLAAGGCAAHKAMIHCDNCQARNPLYGYIDTRLYTLKRFEQLD